MKAGRAFIIILALAVPGVTGRGTVHASGGQFAPFTAWTRQAELNDPPPQSFDFFAYSVALSGNTALVGAPLRDNGPGTAYVFVRRGTVWTQQAELTVSDGSGCFGNSVALFGDSAVIGAPCGNNGGAAYVFIRNGTVWTQQAELRDPTPAASNDSFGISVALSGDTALVGAIGRNNYAGAAYIFVRQGGVWSQQAELDDPAPAVSGDSFGWSVALDRGTALVGAPFKNQFSGQAYVFVRSGTVWGLQATLSGAPSNLGWSVALSGDTALAGAISYNVGGAVYMFTRSGARWTQQAVLTASDGAPGDTFGWFEALSGNTMLIGAPGRNDTGTSVAAGAAYVLVRSGASWTQQAELDDPTPVAAYDGMGNSGALDGDTALVGAYCRNNCAGAAYVLVHS